MTAAEQTSQAEPTVGIAPWHGLIRETEKIGTHFSTGAEMVSALGLDWGVETRPLELARTGERYRNYHEVLRKDTGETIGIVRSRFRPIQNADAFGFLPALAGQHGLQLTGGGELDGGSRVWLKAKLGEHVFKGRRLANGEIDQIDQYLIFWNSHDGSSRLRLAALPYDIWCANALASAWQDATMKWTVPHTASALFRLAEAHKSIARARGWMDDFVHQMEALEKERFTSQQMRAYAEQVLADVQGLIKDEKAKREDGSPTRVGENRERSVDKLVKLFEGEAKTSLGRSKLDAYQAVTEYVDHHRRRARRAGDAQRVAQERFREATAGYNSARLRDAALRRLRS